MKLKKEMIVMFTFMVLLLQAMLGLFMIKYFMGALLIMVRIFKKLCIGVVVMMVSIWNITFGSISALRINI